MEELLEDQSQQQQMDRGRIEFKYHHTSGKFLSFFSVASPRKKMST